jgi:hypothetical protein
MDQFSLSGTCQRLHAITTGHTGFYVSSLTPLIVGDASMGADLVPSRLGSASVARGSALLKKFGCLHGTDLFQQLPPQRIGSWWCRQRLQCAWRLV